MLTSILAAYCATDKCNNNSKCNELLLLHFALYCILRRDLCVETKTKCNNAKCNSVILFACHKARHNVKKRTNPLDATFEQIIHNIIFKIKKHSIRIINYRKSNYKE